MMDISFEHLGFTACLDLRRRHCSFSWKSRSQTNSYIWDRLPRFLARELSLYLQSHGEAERSRLTTPRTWRVAREGDVPTYLLHQIASELGHYLSRITAFSYLSRRRSRFLWTWQDSR